MAAPPAGVPMCCLLRSAPLRLASLLVLLLGLLAPAASGPAYALRLPARVALRAVHSAAPAGGQVYTLPRRPVHLWQHNPAPDAYRNPMGCGAFSTAMALSVYDPARYGTYDAARALFGQMVKVPLFGGTFESQNAVVATQAGFIALNRDHGTLAELEAALNLGAPVILLIDPGLFGIGRHDVVLVGYSVGPDGRVQALLVDNPARVEAARPDAPAEPGNQAIPVGDLPRIWTGVFTPIFAAADLAAAWQAHAGR